MMYCDLAQRLFRYASSGRYYQMRSERQTEDIPRNSLSRSSILISSSSRSQLNHNLNLNTGYNHNAPYNCEHSNELDNFDLTYLEEQTLVGALKVTERKVTYTIYTVPYFGKIVREEEDIPTRKLENGWIEQDANDLINSCQTVINRGNIELSKFSSNCKKRVLALGITTQLDSVVCWDSKTKQPLSVIILGKDSRTYALFNQFLKECGNRNCLINETGLSLNATAAAFKIKWMIENNNEVGNANREGTLKVGTVDSWIIWNLTNGDVHATDCTNAARTMLMNIKQLDWDPVLLEKFKINLTILPKIKSNSEYFGQIRNSNFCLVGMNITASISLPNSGLIGSCSVLPGQAIAFNDSSSTFLAINNGKNFSVAQNVNQITVAYKMSITSQPVYATERIEELNGTPSQNISSIGGHLDTNITSLHTEQVEALIGQIDDTLKKSKEASGQGVNQLTVVGYVGNNGVFMQTQANRSSVITVKPSEYDVTSRGAAILAAHGEHLFAMNKKSIKYLTEKDKVYYPIHSIVDNADDNMNNNEGLKRTSRRSSIFGSLTGLQTSRQSRLSTGSLANSPQFPVADSSRNSNIRADDHEHNLFTFQWEQIDLKIACIFVVSALLLMILGHLIGRALTKPKVVFVRKYCR